MVQNEQQQAARVKREREDSVATVMGDDDGEVVWMEPKSKRARSVPGPGDEVVGVEV